jgi:nitrate/nitrite-specific signal transduction histidine kinase
VEAVLQAMIRFNLFIAILTLLAIFFVAYLITTRVVQAVLALQTAARALEKDSFMEQQLEETTQRKDELGDLARTFQQMANRVSDREERLREEVTRLTIHIDTIQKHDAVEKIVSSDYFKHIEEKARLMRFRRGLAEDNEEDTSGPNRS